MVVQGMRAIDDEFGGAMGPNGEAWDQLLNHMLPGSSESGPPPSFVQIAAPVNDPTQSASGSASGSASVHPETSNAPEVNQTLPGNPTTSSNLTPTRPNVTGAAAIPAAASPKELTEDQRQAEWKLIVHYMDARSKMSQDHLARAHAAFARWFGWAPSKEEMQKAREVGHTIFRLIGIAGPWCSPFATQIWMKATHDRSIAQIRELKKTDWTKAGRLAAYIGARLKQEDKPKPTDAASSSAPTMKSLIVKLKVKADAMANGDAQPQSQPQAEPQTAPQDQMQSNAVLPEQHMAVIPVSSTGPEPPQAPPTQQQFGPNNNFSGYVHQTLPDGFYQHAPAAMPTPAGNFGIDPRMTLYHHPMTVYPGPAAFPDQFANPAPLLEPMSAFPVGTLPAASGWVNPWNWIAERAASLGRSLLPSSQGQADDSARSSQAAPSASHVPEADAMDIVDIGPAATKNVQPVEGEADDDADPNDQLHNEMLMHSSANDDADPGDQLHNEMLMHSSPSPKDTQPEKQAEKEKEPEEKHVPTSPGPKQQQAVVVANKSSAKKKAKQLPTVPTAKAAEKKSKAAKPAAPHYNYGADVTPDPRANALVAYIVAAWKITNKQALVEDAAAMQQLGAHATAAIPFLIQDNEAKESTRGMFRWGDQLLTWEMTLKKLDKFAETRALQRQEVEKARDTGSSSAAKPDDATNHLEPSSSSSSSVNAQPPAAQTPTPLPTASTMPPKSKARRDPYPDASIVAIAGLTPDARANAFAAHLAKTFYRTHGVDLMADEAGIRRLMLHATRNEHRLRGAREVTNYEMNFYAGEDLSWKMTGFRLDALEQEWLKRFPPDESEGEAEQQEEEGADEGEDGDVEMGGTAEPDIDKDTNEQADAQQPGAEQLHETSMASSGLSSVPSGILSPVERPSPAPSSPSSSSAHTASSDHFASAASTGSKKRGRSEQRDGTTTTTTAEVSDPAAAILTSALGSPVPSATAATATATATADTNNDNDTASEPQQPPAKKQRLSPPESLPQPEVSSPSSQPVPSVREEDEEMKEEKGDAAVAPLAEFEALASGTGSAGADEKEVVQKGGQAAGTDADDDDFDAFLDKLLEEILQDED
ncbi:hypothetical protein DIS24_g11093 [Lasiodiplodia hormozganensis]|uniref:Uncharacterized protein n=1 Tax=Lasiodiplodia hormozganensis TaxID=869390 RepID=A0AA40C625_9PEZI|nr:hypothetical protein DIS24_g11093 [Lasiodiplodia hormozganensis]